MAGIEGVNGVRERDMEVRLPRATKVKNKQAADKQVIHFLDVSERPLLSEAMQNSSLPFWCSIDSSLSSSLFHHPKSQCSSKYPWTGWFQMSDALRASLVREDPDSMIIEDINIICVSMFERTKLRDSKHTSDHSTKDKWRGRVYSSNKA